MTTNDFHVNISTSEENTLVDICLPSKFFRKVFSLVLVGFVTLLGTLGFKIELKNSMNKPIESEVLE